MITVTKSTDALPIGSAIFLLYGQPGVGKTSTGATAEAPLLLDFDRGARRSAFRPDTVQINAWGDVAGISADDLTGYKTLVVDTAGRALDFLAASMPTSEGKTQLKRSSGDLTLQGYGALKGSFTAWLKRITTFGLDVVLLAHDKEDKDGDSRIIRPDVMGGSYSELLKVADFVGYLYRDGNRRNVLDFNPTDRWVGKNSAQLQPLVVPNFVETPNWFGGVIADCKKALGAVAEAQKVAVDQMAEIRGALSDCDDADMLTMVMDSFTDLPKPLKLQAWNLVTKRAKEIGLKWNKDAGEFLPAEAVEAA